MVQVPNKQVVLERTTALLRRLPTKRPEVATEDTNRRLDMNPPWKDPTSHAPTLCISHEC